MSALAWIAAGIAAAAAQEAQPIIVPSQSSVYNQTSVNLPAAPTAYGQDVVRAADGVSCQSAVSGAGAYVDVGLIGSQDVYARDTTALYGRVVMPLGKRPKRVDCTRLYELEIARMKMELEMLRLGGATMDLAPDAAPVSPTAATTLPPVPQQPGAFDATPRVEIAPIRAAAPREASAVATAVPLPRLKPGRPPQTRPTALEIAEWQNGPR